MSMKLIRVETNPEVDPYHSDTNQPTQTILRIYKNGDYEIVQDYDDHATPMDEWLMQTLAYQIKDRPDQKAAKEYLESEEAVALVNRIHTGHSIEWDGSNHVGRLTDDAAEAVEDLLAAIASLPECQMTICDAGDWFSGCEIGVSDATTDSEIEALAEKLEADALAENVILAGVENFLRQRRDEARADS